MALSRASSPRMTTWSLTRRRSPPSVDAAVIGSVRRCARCLWSSSQLRDARGRRLLYARAAREGPAQTCLAPFSTLCENERSDYYYEYYNRNASKRDQGSDMAAPQISCCPRRSARLLLPGRVPATAPAQQKSTLRPIPSGVGSASPDSTSQFLAQAGYRPHYSDDDGIESSGAPSCGDIPHCHILPAVDDGSQSLEIEPARCLMRPRRLESPVMVCTPHCRSPYFDFDAMWEAFNRFKQAAGGFPSRWALRSTTPSFIELGVQEWAPYLGFEWYRRVPARTRFSLY